MQEQMPTFEFLKDSPKLLPMIYTDCAQPAVRKVGKALETVLEFGNTILLPLKLVNDKARLNFQKHMENYKRELEEIDSEKIIEVPTIMGTPIIDRLTYVTNDEIAGLFINLLVKASSSDTINESHPSFIHIIDRMTIDEARLIHHLSNADFIPYINIFAHKKESTEFRKLAWNLTGLEFDVELICPRNIDTYLDNFSSLRIIESQGTFFKADISVYKKLEEKYANVIDECNQHPSIADYDYCEIKKHFFEITELGKSFMKACSQKAIP